MPAPDGRGGAVSPAGRPAPRTEDDFERWVAGALERADPFMSWLGVLFALLVGYELAVELGASARRAIAVVGWLIWGVFAVELVAHLYVAPNRWQYIRRHPLRVIGVLIPMLRFLRFLRLLRLGRALPAARVVTSSYRVAGTARRLLRARLAYLAALSLVVSIAVAELAYLFERDARDGVFTSFGDALLWALGTVVALQGDPRPVSVGAQLAMLAGFVFGVVVVASLAGTLGAFFVEDGRERDRPSGADPT